MTTAQATQWGWDWVGQRTVALFRDGIEIARMGTTYPSRDGLRLVDLAREHQPARVQVSDHGVGRKSAQLFAADGTLLADYTF